MSYSVDLLKTQVKLYTKTRKRPKTLKFSFHPEKSPDLSETLMCNFSDLKLTEEEKRNLSKYHRQEICFYKNTPQQEIEQCSQELIDAINAEKSNGVIIQAGKCGTFICLAAFYSGKIHPSKSITFELDLAPIALFPKKLIRSKKCLKDNNIQVVFRFAGDNWIQDFESLLLGPGLTDQFSFISDTSDEEEIKFKFAA